MSNLYWWHQGRFLLESQAVSAVAAKSASTRRCIMEWTMCGNRSSNLPFCKQIWINEGMVTINPSIGAPEAPTTEPLWSGWSRSSTSRHLPQQTQPLSLRGSQEIKTGFYDQGVRPRLLIVNQSSENTDLKLITDSMPSLVIGNLYQDPKVVDRYRGRWGWCYQS